MSVQTLQKTEGKTSVSSGLRLSAKNVFMTLVAVSVTLVVISFVGVVILNPYEGDPYNGSELATPTALSKIVLRFDVIQEGNIPSWFSGVILFVASALLGVIGAQKYVQRDRFRWQWLALAGLFLLFSLDEIAYLHEGVSNFMKQQSNEIMQLGYIVPAVIFVGIVGLWYLPFIRGLPPQTRRQIILAAFLFVFGALKLEIVENVLLRTHDLQSALVLTVNHFQDLLEMLGVSLFIYALLAYIRSHMSPLRLVVH